MTAEQATLSWGKPSQVNRTITEKHISEQWIYEGEHYLYFDDGILQSIQD
jgi:hypothetical protein